MKIAKYFCVGSIAAIVDIALFAIFASYMQFNYMTVAIFSFILATLINHYLSIRYVFESGIRFKQGHELILIFIVSGVGLALNTLALFIQIEYLELNKINAKIVATGVVFLWNYALRANYIFDKNIP
jgi:putative flippase GtrA